MELARGFFMRTTALFASLAGCSQTFQVLLSGEQDMWPGKSTSPWFLQQEQQVWPVKPTHQSIKTTVSLLTSLLWNLQAFPGEFSSPQLSCHQPQAPSLLAAKWVTGAARSVAHKPTTPGFPFLGDEELPRLPQNIYQMASTCTKVLPRETGVWRDPALAPLTLFHPSGFA